MFKITLKSYGMGLKKKQKAPVFFMKIYNFARFSPVFLLKKRPFFARFFIKWFPFEEIATLAAGPVQGQASEARVGTDYTQ